MSEKNSAHLSAQDVIEKLNLVPLPEEGGFYRETFRARGMIPKSALPNHSEERCYSTQILYLLTPSEFSGLHRVKNSDEFFHFYLGDPVEMVKISDSGDLERITIGSQIDEGHQLQVPVPAGIWQGTRLKEGGRWALLGCTVAPGFEFQDFEIRSREEFLELFPQHEDEVKNYTRPN